MKSIQWALEDFSTNDLIAPILLAFVIPEKTSKWTSFEVDMLSIVPFTSALLDNSYRSRYLAMVCSLLTPSLNDMNSFQKSKVI